MAEISYGAKFFIKDGTSSTYKEVDNVTSMKPPAAETGTVETTHLQSPQRYKEYIAGLTEPGECEVTAHYTSTLYTRLIGLQGDDQHFRVEFNDDQEVDFAGFITKVEPTVGGAEELKMINFTVKVTGVLDVHAVSSSSS